MKKFFSFLPVFLILATAPLAHAQSYAGIAENADGITIVKSPTKKGSFFGAPHIKQPAATVPTRTALELLGLVAPDSGTTATANSGAATLSKVSGTITSEALVTTAGADYTLTLTNTLVSATSLVFASCDNGTNTTAGMAIGRITPGSGSVTILVRNTHASAAWNGTIKIRFFILQ